MTSVIERDKKQELWDQAKVVTDVEHRLPSTKMLWLKILLRVFVGICFGLIILALACIQMTSFAVIIGQEGLRHIQPLQLDNETVNACNNEPFSDKVLSFRSKGFQLSDLCSNKKSINHLSIFMEELVGNGVPHKPQTIDDGIKSVGLSHFAMAACLIIPEIRGFIVSLYFVIFRNREVKNSTKTRNVALIVSELVNGAAMAALTFIVLPRLSLFEASIIPYMTLAGPLIVTLVHRSSLHPGGWIGLMLDIIGFMLLLASIVFIGFEYYWNGILGLDFNLTDDYYMVVAAIAVFVYGFNSYSNYSRLVPATKEEGLYWANLISTVLRMAIFIAALVLTLHQYAIETNTAFADTGQLQMNETLTVTYFFEERFNTPLFSDISGVIDFATIICVVSSVLLSYFSISAVRLQYQVLFMIIPVFIGMILVSSFLFLLPFLEHDEVNDASIDRPLGPVILSTISWEIEIVKKRFIVQVRIHYRLQLINNKLLYYR